MVASVCSTITSKVPCSRSSFDSAMRLSCGTTTVACHNLCGIATGTCRSKRKCFGPEVNRLSIGKSRSYRSPHRFLDSPLEQPRVHRIGGEEADDHCDLHEKPEARLIGMQMRLREENEVHQCHPHIHADLKSDD